MLVVDSREASRHKPLVNKLKKKLGEEYVNIEALPFGDFVITGTKGTVVLERKTISDLCGSFASKRLFPQLNGLSDLAKANPNVKVGLLLEGHIDIVLRYQGWNLPSIAGILSSVPLSWNMPILPSMNQGMTTLMLVSIHKNLGETKEKVHLDFKPKADTPEEQALRILGSFPAVGAVKAKRVLTHFKTVRDFLFLLGNKLVAPNHILGKADLDKIDTAIDFDYQASMELNDE